MVSEKERRPASLAVASVGMFEVEGLGLGLSSNIKLHLIMLRSFLRVERLQLTPAKAQGILKEMLIL